MVFNKALIVKNAKDEVSLTSTASPMFANIYTSNRYVLKECIYWQYIEYIIIAN